LLEQLRRAKLDNVVVVEFTTKPLLAAMARAVGSPADQPPLDEMDEPVKTVLSSVESASLVLNLQGDTLAHLRVTAKDEAAATMLAAIATSSRDEMKKDYAGVKAQPPQDIPPPLAKALLDLGDQLLSGTKFATQGRHVDVTAPMPAALADLSKMLFEMLGETAARAPKPQTRVADERGDAGWVWIYSKDGSYRFAVPPGAWNYLDLDAPEVNVANALRRKRPAENRDAPGRPSDVSNREEFQGSWRSV
jgi:hypothetical protein